MTIIEIKTLENGSHRNATGEFTIIPEGWAVIPDDIKCENFPFGEATTEEVDGVMTVTNWAAGEKPIAGAHEEPISKTEQLRADIDYLAVMTGVEL